MQAPSEAALRQALAYNFGHDGFRPHQLEAIQATLAGRDTLLILPTGGGKSLTFQLPALAKGDCFTVVVGPLMALAKDQVDACLDKGIDARVYNSDTSDDVRKGIHADLISDAPDLRLLYTTPESLRNPTLRGYLKEAYEAGTLLSFAIDEAHCVSEWGQDFRPAYLELASLKVDFPNTPITALTASCTPVVEAGIIKLLRLQDPLLVKGGFNRPNIKYAVLFKELIGKQDDVVEHLVEFIKQRQGQCGIVYARLRATCDWLGSALGGCDLDVGVYHAGKDTARRRQVQRDWSEGGLDIVVATVAFGMGIDRSDVRWVVHWDAPSSLEGFYQESGRAGRDGQPSEALMYCSADDLDSITKLERGSRTGCAAAVARFACQDGCRRRKILAYFGQKSGPCSAASELLCDHCAAPAATRKRLQAWEEQLHSKAVAHTLRQPEQERAAAGSGSDEGEGGEDGVSAAGAGEPGGADAVTGLGQRRAPGWVSAAGGGAKAAPVLAALDANTRPEAGPAPAAATGSGQGAALGGVLPPSQPPAAPVLRKRSRSQQQAQVQAGFKAPRMMQQQQEPGGGGSSSSSADAGSLDADGKQQQQARGSSGIGAGLAAAAAGGAGAPGVRGGAAAGRGGMLRGRAGPKAFVPPFKR